MKHWVFILTLSILLSSKPSPVSQGQIPRDTTQKIPLTVAIANKEAEKQSLFDSLHSGHGNITTEITRLNKKKPVVNQPKVIIKHEIRYIHDTIYVIQTTEGKLKIVPVAADVKPVIKTVVIKRPSFFQRLFHRKKIK